MKVLIAGDYCSKNRVKDSIRDGRYSEMFSEIKPIVEQADISIVNFEFPIIQSKGQPILKCGPNLHGSKESVDAVKYAGFNVCTLANNHILDQGVQSCLGTRALLEKEGIKTVGIGNNLQDASNVLYITKDDETVAVINCCEHEFSIATTNTSGANPLNPIQQYYQIKDAKLKADHVLVIVHGGHEHFQLPSPRMKETYRFFINAGADCVINHHQHCYSGYEIYKEKPIFYGLGNLLFDHATIRHGIWNEGYMVMLDISTKGVKYNLIPYSQCNETVSVNLLVDKEESVFKAKIDKLNHIIVDDDLLNREFQVWMECKKKSIKTLFEPYNTRVGKYLYKKGALPSFLPKKKWLRLTNMLTCESHYDIVKYIFNTTK